MDSTALTEKQKNALIARLDQERFDNSLNATREFLSGAADLAAVFGEKGAKIAQAFAITEATISTYQGANKALGAYAPPFNYIAAAGVVAAGLANVARIRSQSVGNFTHGGVVPGSSFSGDRLQAGVNSGEVISNSSQQANLLHRLSQSKGNGGGGNNITIINNGAEIEQREDSNGNLELIINAAVSRTKRELTTEAQLGGGDFVPALGQAFSLRRGQ
jgi:hypothetical protein